jgi:hypothetical protein
VKKAEPPKAAEPVPEPKKVQPPKAAEAPKPAEPAKQAEAPKAPAPAAVQVQKLGKAFFDALLAGNARAAAELSTVPFVLEDKTLRTLRDLEDEWDKQLRVRRTDLLTVDSVEVMTPVEAEKKFGQPPKRLTQLPWKNAGSFVVVGRLSGRPAVAIFKESAGSFKAIGYTD